MVLDDPGVLAALPTLAWPALLLLAWLLGETAHRTLGLPRISAYALVGVVAAPAQLGWLPAHSPGLDLVAYTAFGLLLFEFGYRVNLRWFRHNPWLGGAALADALLCFLAIGAVARWLGADAASAALLAALGMASSPAALVRVLNEERAAGQIAERLIHVAVVGCVLAVLAFKAVLAVHVYQSSGSLAQAAFAGGWALLLSAGLGLLAGVAMPALLSLPEQAPDSTLPYALAVIGLVGLSHLLQGSPIVAALAFGLTARHRRVVFARSARGFGPLGDLLTLTLFVYLGSRLDLAQVHQGLLLGLALVLTRLLVTPAVMAGFAHVSGTTPRKGALTGIGLMPLSAFALLLLEQSRHLQIDLLDQLAPLAAAILVLELAGPLCTRLALRWGGETR
ncbi:cation:proton antiporter [Inhella proteolytica]|uniref:Cation:proton antiporter n=1 Tax=Inhella proteolytica TaxID=2795029 RepID=A0A931JBM0_9BURK|nr:cation:proton antiporter [Inhella proteolytica]MBH9579615.1 cation:proton antiporter [Inhella proteolytica]